MTSQDPFDQIEQVDIPDLKDESPEEQLYSDSEPDIHADHVKAQMAERSKEIIRELTLKNDDLKMLSTLRRQYSWAIYGLSAIFLVASMAIVILSAISTCPDQGKECSKILQLSDNVLITILGTNTTQVIGILYIVANWLYPNNQGK